MINLSVICDQLPKSDLINAALHSLKEAESDAFFAIAAKKAEIYRIKRAHFKGKSFKHIFVVKNNTNFGYLSDKIASDDITFLDSSFFSQSNLKEIKTTLEDSLTLMTNNVFAKIGASNFLAIYEENLKTVFAIHDYDNHHWLQNSALISLLCDVYIPAHQESLLICSRLNPNVIGGIPCGTNQWSKDFISSSCVLKNSKGRRNDPLGKYYPYEQFLFRNKIVNTLEKTYPNISLIKNDFHSLSQSEKWEEWSSHKLHWIIPVLNDLPIRFFDALVTGGVPLVPRGLIPYIQALQIPEEFYSSYGPLDVIEPQQFIEENLKKFEELGDAGITKRHQFALEHFHIDKICGKIIEHTKKMYCY